VVRDATDIQTMTYFTAQEFHCRCGVCPRKDPDPFLVERLNLLREALGSPVVITSGWRCIERNRVEGGKPDSSHLTGCAADISCVNSAQRYRLVSLSLRLFNRIGIGSTFIHVDVDSNKPKEIIWLYENA
jgi:uncharacterized protein YcbK (DUF882 family)